MTDVDDNLDIFADHRLGAAAAEQDATGVKPNCSSSSGLNERTSFNTCAPAAAPRGAALLCAANHLVCRLPFEVSKADKVQPEHAQITYVIKHIH